MLVYPFPAKWIYGYWHTAQKKLKKIRQKIDDDTPLTIEESRELRRELQRLESEFDTEIARKNNEIDRHKRTLSNYESMLSSSKRVAKTATKKNNSADMSRYDELKDEQLKIIQIVASAGGIVADEYIFSNLSLDKVKILYFIEDLESMKYLKRRTYVSEIGEPATELTTQGKKLAIDMGMLD